jgi:hypothetical protein
MIIPVTIIPSTTNPKLPPGLAKISHDEIVLVELQGSLEVECNNDSERDGKAVGKLTIDEATVGGRGVKLLPDPDVLFNSLTPIHTIQSIE